MEEVRQNKKELRSSGYITPGVRTFILIVGIILVLISVYELTRYNSISEHISIERECNFINTVEIPRSDGKFLSSFLQHDLPDLITLFIGAKIVFLTHRFHEEYIYYSDETKRKYYSFNGGKPQ